jgi:tRNA-dihydrouridine synthase A
MLGLFAGRPGARAWRRHLAQAAHRPGAGPEIIAEALALTRDGAPPAGQDAGIPVRIAGG